MQDTNTLVTFSSRTGETEKLALAAGVGAVQARAFIRLRWLRETVDDPAIGGVPGWRENRDRMAQEYIAPREIDFLWADALVIGMPARAGASSPELETYLDALRALQSGGKLHGKVVAAFTAGSIGAGQADAALIALYSAFSSLDLIVVPPDLSATGNPLDRARDSLDRARDSLDRARLQGRRATEVARALKRASV